MKQPILYCLLLVLFSACHGTNSPSVEDTAVSDARPVSELNDNQETSVKISKKIVVSSGTKPNTYVLYGLETTNNDWTITYDTTACTVGYNGIAKTGEKREGDGKTPAGTFELGEIFGYDNDLELDSNFIELEPYHYWISDSSSPLYNTLIDYDPAPLEAEKMERSDHLYKYGIVINYNTDPVVPGNGSAIFLHIYRSPDKPTAGCVAVSEQKIIELIHWLQDADHAEISILN